MKLTTANGRPVSMIGLGTFPLIGREIADIVKEAIHTGYHIIDTADDYKGESGIGTAVNELLYKGIKRGDFFLQTKISANASWDNEPLNGIYFNKYSQFMKRHSCETIVREKVDTSLRKMHTDYLDSLLIHVPYSDYNVEIWTAMIKLQKEGKVRYIGVSNFHARHIKELERETGVLPAINEIYISPIGTKQEQIDYHREHGIQIMSYSPLMDVAAHRIPEEALKSIMQKYGKSLAQIVLRWNIERGCIPLGKTKNKRRIKENFDVLSFSLTQDEMDIINALNHNFQYLPESRIAPAI